MNRVTLDYTVDEMEVLVIGVAEDTISYKDAVQWITEHVC